MYIYLILLSNFLEILKVVWPQLVDDTREEILKLLVLSISADHVGVRSDGRLDLLLEVCVRVCR